MGRDTTRLPGAFSILFAFCICIMAVFFVVEGFNPAEASHNIEAKSVTAGDHADHEHVHEGFNIPGLPAFHLRENVIRINSFSTAETSGIIIAPNLPPPENLII
jgi:hypothetical protein